MTVWKVVERLNMVKIETEELLNLSDDEINYILFPERSRRGEGFLAIDFKCVSTSRLYVFVGADAANER